jgi:hypothetical protein
VVPWVVAIADEFEPEFDELPEEARTEILALSLLLEQFGRNWAAHAWTR